MTERRKLWLSWSSGKDAAWSLEMLNRDESVEVTALLTTVSAPSGRVAMHEVRPELLRAQAAAVGIELIEAAIPSPCSNADYEAVMSELVSRARSEGVTAMAFGDLFLEDIRRYREDRLGGSGIEALFPLWGRATLDLAREMIAGGLRATLTSVDSRRLPAAFAGRAFDESLLADLPAGVDPCGENGEFHSFVHDGPGFAAPLPLRLGELSERDGFVYRDLYPRSSAGDGPDRSDREMREEDS